MAEIIWFLPTSKNPSISSHLTEEEKEGESVCACVREKERKRGMGKGTREKVALSEEEDYGEFCRGHCPVGLEHHKGGIGDIILLDLSTIVSDIMHREAEQLYSLV